MKQAIEQLLEKYYEGETTLAEEKQLRAFFQQETIPAHLQSHAAQFRYFADARQEHPSLGFNHRLAKKLLTPERSFWLSAPRWQAAASVLILLVGFAGGYVYRQWQPGVTGSAAEAASGESASTIREVLAFEGSLRSSASERIQAVNQSTELGQVDEDITQLLINTLNFDANVNVRLAACQALLRFEREPGVREALIQSLAIQTDPNVQISLIDALVTIKEQRAVQPMKQLAENQQVLDAVRQKAEEGLQRLNRTEQRPS